MNRFTLPIEITDPFVEAIRSAQEVGAEIFLMDPDVGERPHLKDLYPDSYALRRLGSEKYVDAYRLYPQKSSFELKFDMLQGLPGNCKVAIQPRKCWS